MEIKCQCHDPACKSEVTTYVEAKVLMISVVESSATIIANTANVFLDAKATQELIEDLQRKLALIQ